MTPRLMLSTLTGRVYVVTKYKVVREGSHDVRELIEAREKFDVTDDFTRIVCEQAASGPWSES